MTRGFITIATGNLYYSKLAENLLLSYRYHSINPMPFAVLVSEENQYTELFDDVVVVENPYKTFMDKFYLFSLCPYDETIFLDADSLAYGDLNEYWNLFENATDFSAVGGVLDISEKGKGNYDIDSIWKYSDGINYMVWIHAGVCFIRKSPSLLKLYNDCMDIYANYDKLSNLRNAGSYDEVTLGIAMPMNNMKPVSEPDNLLAFMPCCTSVNADIVNGKLSYTKLNGAKVKDSGVFLHFTTKLTHSPLYDYEVAKLRCKLKADKAKFLERFKSRKIFYFFLILKHKVLLFGHYLTKLPYRLYGFMKRIFNR